VTADVHQQLGVSDSTSLRRYHSDQLVGNLTPFRFPICIGELSHVFFSCLKIVSNILQLCTEVKSTGAKAQWIVCALHAYC